jgi:hypothetical protein
MSEHDLEEIETDFNDTECVSCRRLKANLTCGLCAESVCKKCAHRLGHNAFQFLEEKPEAFTHTAYCDPCYASEVEEAFLAYEADVEKARGVFIFFKTQRKEIPLVKKTNDTLSIVDCIDRDEAILRMAFQSARAGYNAVIEVEVSARKVKEEAYQKYLWKGTGRIARIDEVKLGRQDLQNEIYR